MLSTPTRDGGAEMALTVDPAAYAITVRIADIETQPLRWLWPGRIPLGKVTMLIGDPGLGKSLLTVAIAAAVSVGARWPDGASGTQGDVLLLSAEDDAADTIRPRLEAAGADLARVHVLRGIREFSRDGEETRLREFSLRRDIEVLNDLLVRIGDVVAVIVDPVSAYFEAVDTHNNADVRGTLAPLAALAMQRRVAILTVSHLNKGGSSNALYRATGSLGFVAAARSVMLAARESESGRRVIVPVKNNLAPESTGLAYEIEQAANRAAVIAWHPDPVTMTAGEALAQSEGPAERSELREACDWLRELLADGPVLATDVKAQAREAGHAWITVRRAKGVLRVRTTKRRFDGRWEWDASKLLNRPLPSKPERHAQHEQHAEDPEDNAPSRPAYKAR
jgi:putative DNA primase/helicase